MKKILYVAKREFLATVMAKGFLFGIMLTPAIILFMAFFLPRFITKSPPRIDGQIAVYDPTGQVADDLAVYLSPEQFLERRARAQKQLRDMAAAEVGGLVVARAGIDTNYNVTLRWHKEKPEEKEDKKE